MLSLFGFGMCIYCMGDGEREFLLYVAFCALNSQLLVRVIYTICNMKCRKKNLHGSFYAAMFTVLVSNVHCSQRRATYPQIATNETIRSDMKRGKKTIERQRHVNDCNVNVALKLCAIFLFTSTSKQRYTFCTICCYCYSFIF